MSILGPYLSRPAVFAARVEFPDHLFTGTKWSYWDAANLSSMFADVAGTTPATVGGVVMLQQDLSGNGRHRSNSNSATAPILRQRTDGAYYLDYAGGKTLSVVSDKVSFKHLHDGTGGSFFALIEWTQGTGASNYLQTCTGTTGHGIQVIKSASGQHVTPSASRGVSGQQACSVQYPYFASSSPVRLLGFGYKNSGTSSDAKAWQDSGRTPRLGATLNAPSSSNHSSDLHVATTFGGHEYFLIQCDRVLTDTEVTELWAWAKQYDYPAPASYDLAVLVKGQSNNSGRGLINSTTVAEDKQVGAYLLTKAEDIRIATEPSHSLENQPIATSPTEPGAPAHSYLVRLLKNLNTATGQNVIGVPNAIGSTAIANWNTPATATDRRTLLGAALYRDKQAVAKAARKVITLVGHEADVALATPNYTTGGVGTAAGTAMTGLLDTIATEVPGADVYLCGVALHDTLASAVNHAAWNEAMRLLAASRPRTFFVPIYDVQRNASPDDIHIATQGMAVVADRLALAIRANTLGESVNWRGPQPVAATYSGAVVTVEFDGAVNASATNFGSLFRVYGNGSEATVSSAVRNADTTLIDITCSAPLTGPVTVTYGYKAGAAGAALTDIVKDAGGLPAPCFGPLVATTTETLGPELVTTEWTGMTNASGGATVVTDHPNRSLEVTVAGSSTSYPRLYLIPGMTPGLTYRVVGVINPGAGNLLSGNPIRLATSGSANNVSYNSGTGVFSGDVVAAADMFEVMCNGTLTGTITIDELSIRQVL